MTPRKFRKKQKARARRICAQSGGSRLTIFAGLVLLSGLFTGALTPAATAGPTIGTTSVSPVAEDLAHSPVGFEAVRVPNGGEPPLAAGIWYPTSAEPRDVPLEFFKQRVALSGPVKGQSRLCRRRGQPCR